MEDESILPKDDYASPFYSSVPLSAQPTEILSKRFELWRQIIKSLLGYLRSIAIAQQQYSRINENLIQTIDFPFFTDIHPTTTLNKINDKIYEPEDYKKQQLFAPFGSGSIQDVQILLKKYHLNLSKQNQKASLELTNNIIPRLDELQKDLIEKIREIKNLNSDFKNSLSEDIALTGQYLNEYVSSVHKLLTDQVDDLHFKKDPYLLRLRLEIQLKHQLNQENSVEEAFINLQITGLELEKIIYQEIQNALNEVTELVSQEIFIMFNDFVDELHNGMIKQKNYFEWDHFIGVDKRNFMKLKHNDEVPIPRKISTVQYPYNKSLVSRCLRSGYLLKRSRFLKSYTRSFFILTLNYLHEFKSSDLIKDFPPINSIKLNDSILSESNDTKFQIHTRESNLKTHNYVFKVIPSEMDDVTFKKWIMDLKNLTSFNNFKDRYKFINNKLNSGSNSISNSRSNTPMTEAPNPMENLARINAKLETLTMTPIGVPTSNNQSSAASVASQTSDNSKATPAITSSPLEKQAGSTEKLHLDVNVPRVEIQGPTPTRPTSISNILKTENTMDSERSLESSASVHFEAKDRPKSPHINLDSSIYKKDDKSHNLNSVMSSLSH